MNIHISKTSPMSEDVGRPCVLALRGWVCDRYTGGGMQGAHLLTRAAAAQLSMRRCSN